MVDAKRLLERVTVGFQNDEAKRLGAYVELSIRCKDEADHLVSKNFCPTVIQGYISVR
jgi:hypothetical protein